MGGPDGECCTAMSDVSPPLAFPGSAFPLGARHVLAHRVTAAELAPVAALLGSSDPALSSRSAATLMTRLLVSRFPGPGTRLLREDFRFAGQLLADEEVELSAEVAGIAAPGVLAIACQVRKPDGTVVLDGMA